MLGFVFRALRFSLDEDFGVLRILITLWNRSSKLPGMPGFTCMWCAGEPQSFAAVTVPV
jgi:hypothetical protein